MNGSSMDEFGRFVRLDGPQAMGDAVLVAF
jgi:hypothetical protein